MLGAAAGHAVDTPAVNIRILSDDLAQVAVNIPVNVCGTTVSILGLAPLTSSGVSSCVSRRPAAPAIPALGQGHQSNGWFSSRGSRASRPTNC
ncbi:chaplin [Streptomyces sp. AK02-04a]|nr:chaplin [Streptomyces sp. AK02-04a]MDX3762793.1 chaplin [Streptomyces sp. AK02-04a]